MKDFLPFSSELGGQLDSVACPSAAHALVQEGSDSAGCFPGPRWLSLDFPGTAQNAEHTGGPKEAWPWPFSAF